MTLREQFESYTPTRPGRACKTCEVSISITEADPSEGDAFQSMLADKVRFSDRTISSILNQHGVSLSASSIRLHRLKCGVSSESET